jgi:HEAT repeat protein
MITHYRIVGALAIVAIAAHESDAQRLGDRIANARGVVAFMVVTRGNVCGDGNGIFVSDDTSPGWNTRRHQSGTQIQHQSVRSHDLDDECEIAPARVVIEHDGTRVTSVRMSVGGPGVTANTDLGRVDAAEAVRYLLSWAPRLDGRSSEDAVTTAAIAAVPKVWPELLAIARDDKASESSRKSALFWVSREASAAAVAGLGSVAEDDDASAGVRSDALFYLAQRKDGAGIDALVRVVRESKSMKMRKDAVWFLSQTRDPRAFALFEELLSGRPR